MRTLRRLPFICAHLLAGLMATWAVVLLFLCIASLTGPIRGYFLQRHFLYDNLWLAYRLHSQHHAPILSVRQYPASESQSLWTNIDVEGETTRDRDQFGLLVPTWIIMPAPIAITLLATFPTAWLLHCKRNRAGRRDPSAFPITPTK